MPPKKPLTRKHLITILQIVSLAQFSFFIAKAVTRSAKKKNAQTELGTSEPLTYLPKSKKLQKLYQAKGKENSDPNLETSSRSLENSVLNLKTSSRMTSNQSEYLQPKEDIEEQAYIDKDQQQIQNHSSFAANKYQHKVLSRVKLRTAVSSIQTNEFDVEPLIQCPNNYGEHLSNHEDRDESSDKSSEDKIFSSLRHYNLIPLNVQTFENYCTTYNNDVAKLASQLIRKKDHDIKKFNTESMWDRPLKKYIDALDYDTFKTESKGENSDYNSMVLNHIKELDSLIINYKFPATSHLQYANQLELKEE
ncbi:24906_t:CDS:2 [Gigaspora margarita]|uniref:24906_t:CDS:1 n=1 Tax=Gigaspora margarita TaxID=4874 RepID=A0ABN7UN77_GIGMA|nr:24906_t:CDS:2 [Gigaspora margarita]